MGAQTLGEHHSHERDSCPTLAPRRRKTAGDRERHDLGQRRTTGPPVEEFLQREAAGSSPQAALSEDQRSQAQGIGPGAGRTPVGRSPASGGTTLAQRPGRYDRHGRDVDTEAHATDPALDSGAAVECSPGRSPPRERDRSASEAVDDRITPVPAGRDPQYRN
ncbi:hypothetical protein [Sporichthya sp.]|uniref:hypothetical protein n=1 Tax=Sporichthya sp. TaxID=65475 RepID=UPI0025E9EF0E|nr:hypothetical protein [Sporichthya sp.]